jgi:hypothetical protein
LNAVTRLTLSLTRWPFRNRSLRPFCIPAATANVILLANSPARPVSGAEAAIISRALLMFPPDKTQITLNDADNYIARLTNVGAPIGKRR